MTEVLIQTVFCTLCEPKERVNCLACGHFCGIKKNVYDQYVVECGFSAQKGDKK